MQSPLHEHILTLETMLQDFQDRLTRASLSDAEREDILAKIQFANDALTHYRKAYELEYVVTAPTGQDTGGSTDRS